ncbi:aminotransferase class IV [Streptomyces sp. NPDC056488]|uniref:aminotransferase class IV n=1 Tax=unclassified Streptomyces TaxID=2593676 RepID=UPI0036CCAC98
MNPPNGPAVAEARLAWDGARGLVPGAPAPDTLLAADSWLVEDGRVRDVEGHRARFTRACRDSGRDASAVERFWRDALAALPRTGAWFPRVELHGDGVLALWPRRAPQLLGPVRVLPRPDADPRTAPHRKGPDLALLARVRAEAQEAGADDALLTTASGAAIESTTASLLWWEDDELCLPEPGPHLLPGVTSALLVRQARESGVVVRYGRAAPEELHDRETWLVNALHGIRPVAAWVGAGGGPAAPAPRAARWQRLLRARARPLPDHRPEP